jgi:basic membrane lipoprotein Med (substrate-binding protein (PBP1-ABC) superfamily)
MSATLRQRLATKRVRPLVVAAVLAIVVAGLVTWALWPDSEPRQRDYVDATACLLTDDQGVTGPQAGPVWTAMNAASASSLVRVQYLQANGPQTAANAGTYLASLAGGRCGVVIAAGSAPVDAVAEVAKTFPAVRFVAVGAGTPSDNVQVIPAGDPDDLQAKIRERVEALAAD